MSSCERRAESFKLFAGSGEKEKLQHTVDKAIRDKEDLVKHRATMLRISLPNPHAKTYPRATGWLECRGFR